MKEKHFCRCCLSEECYKDMGNTYYIGSKTENYFDMLLNIFNINIINDDAERCLICEECVSKLRDAAAFKKKVLDIKEIIKNNICWDTNSTEIDTKIENGDADYFDDFDDNVSDKDFIWENFTRDGSQKGQIFVMTLESNREPQNKHKTISKLKKSKSYEIEIEGDESTDKKSSTIVATVKYKAKDPSALGAIEKDKAKNHRTLGVIDKDEVENVNILDEILNNSAENFNTFDTNGDDSDDMDIDGLDSEEDYKIAKKSKNVTKRTTAKRIVKTKAGTAKQNKDKLNKTQSKQREISQTDLSLKYKSENTLKLVQNSNLCLFRSLRNKFGCIYCPSKFHDFTQLREHSVTHKNPAMLHIKRLRGLSYKNAELTDLKCNLCSERCSDLQNLTDHLKKEHEISFHGTEHYLVPYKLQDGYQCVLCEIKFNSYLRLSVHMNSHYTNNVCESCGISFINRIGLRTHVQSQHKEKKCSRCPAIFLTVCAKSKHLRQVHGIRNSKRHCNICNKTFKYTYMLDEHKIQEHGVKRPPESRCVECGKSFLSPFNLKTHMRSVHIRERNYPCTKCGMRFFTTCDQKRHERTHDDVRSFCCSYCDAKFKSKDSWRRHLKRQHGHVFGEATATPC